MSWSSSNTNPSVLSLSKDFVGFSINLVIERIGFGFHKTSSFESIQCCLSTGFLCISIYFFVEIEAVDNIYKSKSGTESRQRELLWITFALTIVSPVKIEYGWNISISGLKMMVKNGLEKIFLKFLHALGLFQTSWFTS